MAGQVFCESEGLEDRSCNLKLMAHKHPKFNKGDVIVSAPNRKLLRPIYKEIVKVYKRHYTWKYPDIDKEFDSRNSNDPEFVWWELYKKTIT